MMDLFITNTQLLSSQDVNVWTGVAWILVELLVDYYDVFISCLNSHSDGTHSLQSIHWWCNATFLQIWWRNIHLGWLKNILNVSENALWVYLEIWRSRVKCLYLSSCHFPLRWCKAHLPKNGLPPPSKASLGTLHSFALSCWCSGESGCTNFPFPLQILLLKHWVGAKYMTTNCSGQARFHEGEEALLWRKLKLVQFFIFYKQNLFWDFQQEDSYMSCAIGSLGWELFYLCIIINNREMRVQMFHLAVHAQLAKPNRLTVLCWCIYTFINTLHV